MGFQLYTYISEGTISCGFVSRVYSLNQDLMPRVAVQIFAFQMNFKKLSSASKVAKRWYSKKKSFLGW